MKREIIITDLTRFAPGKPIVCTAGIDDSTGECIRPLPYLEFSNFTRMGIFPGGILSGDFTPHPKRHSPHIEDCNYEDLKFRGPCSSTDFHSVLSRTKASNVVEGFKKTPQDGKVFPISSPPFCSIITIRVEPSEIEIVEDSYKPGKIRLHFADASGMQFRHISITDLGFYDYAQRHRESGALDELNSAIADQDEVFLRLGLGRAYDDGRGRNGYWMQANGIYTFPDKLSYVRSYDSK